MENLYSDWLKKESIKIFNEKILKHGQSIGFIPRKTRIKDLKNRWGSLLHDGVINLNVNLIKAPEDIIDYIIIHELCHFKIKGHSYHFWNYLKQFEPDYEQKIKWLEKNSISLL